MSVSIKELINDSQIFHVKGSPISKALTRIKIYLYKQKSNFVKETDTSGYIVV